MSTLGYGGGLDQYYQPGFLSNPLTLASPSQLCNYPSRLRREGDWLPIKQGDQTHIPRILPPPGSSRCHRSSDLPPLLPSGPQSLERFSIKKPLFKVASGTHLPNLPTSSSSSASVRASIPWQSPSWGGSQPSSPATCSIGADATLNLQESTTAGEMLTSVNSGAFSARAPPPIMFPTIEQHSASSPITLLAKPGPWHQYRESSTVLTHHDCINFPVSPSVQPVSESGKSPIIPRKAIVAQPPPCVQVTPFSDRTGSVARSSDPILYKTDPSRLEMPHSDTPPAHGRIPVFVDLKSGSRSQAQKRKANTDASRRSRNRKKNDKAAKQRISSLSEEVRLLQEELDRCRTELFLFKSCTKQLARPSYPYNQHFSEVLLPPVIIPSKVQ